MTRLEVAGIGKCLKCSVRVLNGDTQVDVSSQPPSPFDLPLLIPTLLLSFSQFPNLFLELHLLRHQSIPGLLQMHDALLRGLFPDLLDFLLSRDISNVPPMALSGLEGKF